MSSRGKTFLCLVTFVVLPYVFFCDGHWLPNLMDTGDGLILNYPLRVLTAKIIKAGFWPLWDPYIFCGFPLLAEAEPGCFYPPNILFLVLPSVMAFNLLTYLHFSMAGMFTFLYARNLGLKRIPAVFSGTVYMFCGYLVAQVGQTNYHNAAVWLPLILLCIEKSRQPSSIKYALWGAFFFGIQSFAGSPQISAYTAMVIVLYMCLFKKFSGVDRLATKRFIRSSLIVLVFGLLLAAVQFLPTWELANLTFRGRIDYGFFSDYFFHPKMLPTLFFPNFFGSHAPRLYPVSYWGEWNLIEMTCYMGILPLCLAVMAFLNFRKNKLSVRFWSFIAVLAFVLALGRSNPLYKIAYYIPVYNLFRAPARNWFEYSFAIAILSGIALDGIVNCSEGHMRRIRRQMNVLSGILSLLVFTAVGFIIVFQICLARFPHWQKFSLNFSLRNPAMYVPLAVISLSAGILLVLPKKRRNRIVLLLVLILVFLDLFSFGHFFNLKFKELQTLNSPGKHYPAAKFLLEKEKDPHKYRIISALSIPFDEPLNTIYPSCNSLYPISSVHGGDSSFMLDDYRELLGTTALRDIRGLIENNKILSIVNVKYIVSLLFPPSEQQLVSMAGEVANIEKFLNLEANAHYRLSFRAKALGFPDSALIAGICGYGPTYNEPEIKLTIPPSELKEEFREFSMEVMTENLLGREFCLRIFTLSSIPIIVDSIRLEEKAKNVLFEESFYPTRIIHNGRQCYTKIFERDMVQIFENRNVLSRAYLVSKLRLVDNFDEACSILWDRQDPFDPHREAIVESSEDMPISLGKKGVCEVADYRPNSIFIKTNSEGKNFLVLSETYYPGWKAYIDGEKTKIYRTNGMLRGVLVPSGNRIVKFVYDPWSFKVGGIISLITFISLLIGLIRCRKR